MIKRIDSLSEERRAWARATMKAMEEAADRMGNAGRKSASDPQLWDLPGWSWVRPLLKRIEERRCSKP